MTCKKCDHKVAYSVCDEESCECVCSTRQIEVILDPDAVRQTLEEDFF